jgi:hypothetical protein
MLPQIFTFLDMRASSISRVYALLVSLEYTKKIITIMATMRNYPYDLVMKEAFTMSGDSTHFDLRRLRSQSTYSFPMTGLQISHITETNGNFFEGNHS